jgi:hypothetical protein
MLNHISLFILCTESRKSREKGSTHCIFIFKSWKQLAEGREKWAYQLQGMVSYWRLCLFVQFLTMNFFCGNCSTEDWTQDFTLARQAPLEPLCQPFLHWLCSLDRVFLYFQLAWITILLFVLPHVAGITGTHHLTQSLVEMGASWIYYSSWPQTAILPISTSHVAKITGLSHHAQLNTEFPNTQRYIKAKIDLLLSNQSKVPENSKWFSYS